MSWFRNLKIRTKTFILVVVSTFVISLMIGFGTYTLFQLESDFSSLGVAKREFSLSKDLDRQTHRVWVMVLKLSNIQSALQEVLDGGVIEAQKEVSDVNENVLITRDELNKTLENIKDAQQQLNALLAELENEIKKQETLGYDVTETKQFFTTLNKKSKYHDTIIENVIEENIKGSSRLSILELIFDGMAQGDEMIAMLIDFNSGLEKEVAELERSFDRNVNNLLIIILSILAISLLSLAVVFFFIRNIANSIGTADNAAKEIAKGNLEKRLEVRSKDEIGELALSFNHMVDSVIIESALKRKAEVDAATFKTKSEFSSVFSHQLRSPLTGIKLLIETMEGIGGMNEEQKGYLSEIKQATERELQLVEDLLNVSRAETGKLKITLEPTQLEDFVKEVIQEVSALSVEKNCEIIFQKPKDKLPTILIDVNLTRQIVYNLLTNAIRYSVKKDKCTISVTLERKDSENCLIKIKDNGIGIPKEEQSKIFQKFFRAENAIEADSHGTGLGLYVIKMLVNLLGGKIWFESEENKGTTFYVSLPIENSN